MTPPVAARSMPIAPIIAGIGGILAIVEAFLVWESVTISPVVSAALGSDTPKSLSGLDMDANWVKISIVLGIVAVGLAVAWIMNLKVPSVALIVVVVAGVMDVKIPQSGAILAVLGVLILVVVVLVYFTKLVSDASFVDTADLMKQAGGSAGIGIGVMLEAVGGILAIIGGGMIYMKKA